MRKIYAALILLLMISVSVYAQGKEEAPANGNNCYDYLFLEVTISEEDIWETESASMEIEFPIDIDWLFDLLLDSCLELDVGEEYVHDILPEFWEPEYELFLMFEDDY